MSEKWKTISGYEGLYEISNMGRVRSLTRTKITVLGNIQSWPGKMLKGVPDKDGYLTLTLSRNSKPKQCRIHLLVLLTFHGERPKGMQGCHRNGKCSDNRKSNLRWGTPESNYRDRDRHGTTIRGERMANAKLKDVQREEIRNLYRLGFLTQKQLATRFKVRQSTIWAVLRSKAGRALEVTHDEQ